jgi:quinol monooxygenase YgiN
MITYAVRMKFAPEDRLDIVEVLRSLTAASRQEPGCVTFIPHHVEDDQDTVLIYEQYVDQKALEAHRSSEHFKNMRWAGSTRRCASGMWRT